MNKIRVHVPAMGEDDLQDPRFTSAEVCLAAEMSRGTFDAWLLRRYLPVPAGPGTGKVRKFSMLDAIRIAVMAELSRTNMPVGVAASHVMQINSDYADEETIMVLGPQISASGQYRSNFPTLQILPIKDLNKLLKASQEGHTRSLKIVYVSKIAAHVKGILVDPATHYEAQI